MNVVKLGRRQKAAGERCSEEKSETRKFNERPKGVGRGKSQRAGRERKVDTEGGNEGGRGECRCACPEGSEESRFGGVEDGGGVGPAKTRYAKQAADLNGPAQNEWPHLVLRSLVSSSLTLSLSHTHTFSLSFSLSLSASCLPSHSRGHFS